MNDRNYPLLTKLFLELEIELHPTSMSFSVDTEDISWCSEDFKKFRFFNSFKKIRIFLEMIRFNNIATNDAMVKSKLNEMSSQGWELVFVSSGVESADKERDAIFITRYHFRKEK